MEMETIFIGRNLEFSSDLKCLIDLELELLANFY